MQQSDEALSQQAREVFQESSDVDVVIVPSLASTFRVEYFSRVGGRLSHFSVGARRAPSGGGAAAACAMAVRDKHVTQEQLVTPLLPQSASET
jgi:hypothetical protein